jgi:hypothetical protein
MKIKALFVFLITISLTKGIISAQDMSEGKLTIKDNDPMHSPKIILSYGIGIGSTPHFYINMINHTDLYFNLLNKASFNVKYDNFMKIWDKEFKDEFVSTKSQLSIKSYRNIDLTCNILLFSKNKNEYIKLYSHSTSPGMHFVVRHFLKVPAESRRYLELTLGFLAYRDVISKEKYNFITKDGYTINDSHLNFQNKTFQIGFTYNKDEYLRATLGDRDLQQIKSKRIYLVLLYGPNTAIDPLMYSYNNTIHDIDVDKSGLKFQNIGFKTGISTNRNFLGSVLGLRYGGEVAIFPGIKDLPGDFSNISARFYIQLSLCFLKKYGNNYQL